MFAIRKATVLYQHHDIGLAFFGFLRVSEFTIPSQEQYGGGEAFKGKLASCVTVRNDRQYIKTHGQEILAGIPTSVFKQPVK